MSLDSIMAISRGFALVINITTMFLCMRPKRGKGFTLGCLAGCAVLIVTVTRLAGMRGDVLNYSGLFFLPVVLWLFHGQMLQKVFAFFMQYLFTIQLISLADAITNLTIGYESNLAPVLLLVLAVLLLGAYLAAVLRFGRRLFDRLFINGRPGEWAIYSFGAVASFFIALEIRHDSVGGWLYIGLVLFILWSFGVLCFAIVNTHEKTKHKYEADFAASIISSASGHYQQINELNHQINILQHDMKYNLTVFSKLLAEDNRAELERYLSEVTDRLSKAKPRMYCGNNVVDVLLASYAERCEKLIIKCEVEVLLPKEVSIPNYELCIVLGNLLENAVEACEKIENGKRIRLVMKPLGRQLVIKVANSYHTGISSVDKTEEENSLPQSTKKDGGLGLRSVRAVAEKYNGELIFDKKDGMFTAYVSLELQTSPELVSSLQG